MILNGEHLTQVSFPLGGIGAGCIGAYAERDHTVYGRGHSTEKISAGSARTIRGYIQENRSGADRKN